MSKKRVPEGADVFEIVQADPAGNLLMGSTLEYTHIPSEALKAFNESDGRRTRIFKIVNNRKMEITKDELVHATRQFAAQNKVVNK